MEDREFGDENRIGMSNLSLHGTGDAAMDWQDEFTSTFVNSGFVNGRTSPRNFHHPVRQISVFVHRDDFTPTGPKQQLTWFKTILDHIYECKRHSPGPDKDEEDSIRLLNRVVCWSNDGITYEVDQRHVEVILNQFRLNEVKPMTSPDAREEQAKFHEIVSDDLGVADASR